MHASGERWFGWCHKVTDLQSTRIFRMIELRRLILAGHVRRMGKKKNTCRIFVGKLEERDVEGRIILKWIIEK
jgi:hypothetical protein